MRNSLFVLMATVLISLGLCSCTDDTIGNSISDIHSAIVEDSSFVLQGKSLRNSHLRSRSDIQLLGKVNATGYGILSSDVVSQFMPTTTIDTVGVHGGASWIDSCCLTMRVAKGDFTGDSLVPMRLNVYKLNKQLPSPIYSDFDPTGYYSEDDLLGTTVYSANDIERTQTIDTETGSAYTYYEVNVPLPVELARDMFTEFKNNPETFSTPRNFAQYFPGVYISNSYGEGHVMNFYDIELVTYYKKYEKLTDDTDTIYPAMKQSYLAVTPEVIYNNNINLDVAPSVKAMVDNGDAIVMGPAGYEVQAQFPVQDIINKFKKDTQDALALINTVELTIPAEKVTNKYDIAPPEYLLMVKENYRDEFFDRDSLTNDKDAFYAKYDEETDSYTFHVMRDYVVDILDNKGGIAPESDINFVIMPIDVTLYTNTASSSYYYYYYGSSSSQVVTKIAPAIARPCLSRLRLDKAKINIVYSKQTLY